MDATTNGIVICTMRLFVKERSHHLSIMSCHAIDLSFCVRLSTFAASSAHTAMCGKQHDLSNHNVTTNIPIPVIFPATIDHSKHSPFHSAAATMHGINILGAKIVLAF